MATVVEVLARLRTDNSDWSRGFREAGRDSDNMSKKLAMGSAKGVLQLGALVAAAGPVGPAIGGAAAAVVSLAGGLAVLPAVVGSAGFAVATLKIGVGGFAKALKVAGDEKAFAEALKKLSPEARETAKAIAGMRGEFRELKSAVQDTLFEGMSEQVKTLGGTYLPILKTQMTAFGSTANRSGILLTKALSAPDTKGDVAHIMSQTVAAGKKLEPVLAKVAKAFIDLGGAGADYLPKMASALTGVVDKFSKFITKAKESGQISGWIGGAVQTLKDLGNAAKGIGRIIGGIFGAAQGSGGTGLAILGSTLNKIANEVSKPAFQGGLTTVFAALAAGSKAVNAALPAVAKALVSLAPAFAALAQGSGVALGKVLKDVAGAVQNAAPLLTTIAGVVAGMAPHVWTLVGAYAAWRVASMGLTAAMVIQNAGGILPFLRSMPLVRVATLLWAGAQWLLNASMWGFPLVWIVAAIVAVVAIIVLIATKTTWFQTLWKLAMQAAAAVLKWAKERIREALDDVKSDLHKAGLAIAAMRAAWGRLKTAVASFVSGAVDKIQSFMEKVAALKARITGAFSNAKTLLVSAGKHIVEGLWEGVKGMGGWIAGKVKGFIGSAITGPIKSALHINSPSKVTEVLGGFTGQGLGLGLFRSLPYIVRAAKAAARAAIPKFTKQDSTGYLRGGSGVFSIAGGMARVSQAGTKAAGASGAWQAAIEKRAADKKAAAKRLADAVTQRAALAGRLRNAIKGKTPSSGGGSSTGGSSSSDRIIIEIRSAGGKVDDFILESIRKGVRVRGGNAQLVLGKKK